MPVTHVPGKTYPLVLGLHGGAHNPEQFITLWDHLPSRSFIYAVPQAPYPIHTKEQLAFDWAMWPTGDEELIDKATELSEGYIVNVTQELAKRPDIEGVYLMGWSQGAILTYLVGIKHHSLFDGIICLSGPGLLAPLVNPFAGSFNPTWLTDEQIRDARDLRVLIAHGRDDQSAKYDLALGSREVLEKHGYDVTFRDFEGGHIFPPKQILSDIVAWVDNVHRGS